jgi:hypothetical protein
MKMVFSMYFVQKCYKEDQSSSGVDSWKSSVGTEEINEFCTGGFDKKT